MSIVFSHIDFFVARSIIFVEDIMFKGEQKMFGNLSTSNCACGKEHIFTSKVIAESGAINRLPEILDEISAKRVFLIADKNTYAAAGEKVCEILDKHGTRVKKYVFNKDELEPDEANVGLAVMNFDNGCDAVISVGSGVINDIGKIVANISSKKYIIVGTAPSMDGYASATSSMTVDGLKSSVNSKCADYIVGDIDILAKAPVKMMVSGLGDMLAKYVSICEWRISALINGEYYCEEIAKLVRSSLNKCVSNADGLLSGDKEAVKAVFEGLVVCGAAMNFAGVSRPASGVEHYLSHIWDMRGVEFGLPVEFHGIQCALGTLISVGVYEKIKKLTPDFDKGVAYAQSFDVNEWNEELRAFLGRGAESMIELENKEHKYDVDAHKIRLRKIIDSWDEIMKIVSEELPEYDALLSLCEKLGLPTKLSDIGVDEKILPMTFKASKDIRDKYVLPRLCFDLGIIDEII